MDGSLDNQKRNAGRKMSRLAIREDTPGYIAQAFPKLFPHGTGDFHCLRGGMSKLLKFEEWGRFVLLWHDGRFMRHPRFRYWLLDTVLRTMTPGMQRTFFKTRSVASQYTLEDLFDRRTRKDLVQQMSTATSRLPGSVGERRKMRQELESMVHQLEAETADSGENAGRGRIPAGFCTLTCPVYKWRQLFDTVLKSYPHGDPQDPQSGEYFRLWEKQPPGFARDAAMKKAFYQPAVANPGAVAWYCGLKLEMAVCLVMNVFSEALQDPSTPGLDSVKARMTEHLRGQVGPGIEIEELPDLQLLGTVDDFYASFEWSDGGMVHIHIALWIVGAPRIDKVIVPKENVDEGFVEIKAPIEGETVLPQEEAACLMSAFWERAYTECNLAKVVSSFAASAEAQSTVEAEILRATAEDTGQRIKLGRALERERPSPESLSYLTMRHCLLDGLAEITPQQEQECWQELDHILAACGRQTAGFATASGDAQSPGFASDPSQRRAAARNAFVACLAEWVNMHDLHKPFSLGPPSKDQPCCSVDQEHSAGEKLSCNKLFPRKCISPGEEEIAEDPRRRELFRLWLARNCHFMNNYVPVVLMGMLSNMDFQATLTKAAVIEYMTKYMTKAGQGSLVHVMEHSFSACVDKTRELQQGSGAAILRWFNLQSITEVKSQLETMHLLFRAPRFLCSRDFKDLWLRSEVRVAKSADQIREGGSTLEPIVCQSGAEVYVHRHTWELPRERALLQNHPRTKTPWWQEILSTVRAPSSAEAGSAPVSDRADASSAAVFDAHRDEVECAWPTYLRLMSWWQLKRYFRRSGNSIVCRPKADVVVVHPVGRFTTATTSEQWRDACYWTLLAYCNHGFVCSSTFADARQLDSLELDALEQLMQTFVMAPQSERHAMVMTMCPPHVRKNWLLGCARRERLEARRQPVAAVTEALRKVPRFVFLDEGDAWRQCSTTEMSAEDLAAAQSAWKEADGLDLAPDDDEMSPDKDRLCHPSAGALGGENKVLSSTVRKKMDEHMRLRLKWTHRDLHDALRVAGLDVPGRPSLLNYFRALHTQFGDTQVGFLPQSFQTHTKKKIQRMLRCLSRSGLRLGGKLADKKCVLAERLAYWLNQVVEAGRDVQCGDDEGKEVSDADDDDEPCARPKLQGRYLLPDTRQIGEVPSDAVVAPEQAESALGHAQATEFDEETFEVLDQELREEEHELVGRHVNPCGIDYALLAYDPSTGSTDASLWQRHVWEQALGPPRRLKLEDFAFSAQQMERRLTAGIEALYSNYTANLLKDGDVNVDTLDPTQLLAYSLVAEWSEERRLWLERQSLTAPPELRMVLLGTAGTGKTHTAKLAIAKARRTFGSFHSVLTVAFSGVAAANVGDGARTVDSVFHTNTDNSHEDLTGEALDKAVEMLRHVQLLVIDEVSTVGAAQFEILCRRIEQVGKVLWRERHGCSPPNSLGGWGGPESYSLAISRSSRQS